MNDKTKELRAKYPFTTIVPIGRVPRQHKCPSGKNFAYIPNNDTRMAEWLFDNQGDLVHFLAGEPLSPSFSSLARSAFGYAWPSLISEKGVTTFKRAQEISGGQEPQLEEVRRLCTEVIARAEETARHMRRLGDYIDARRETW